MRKKTTIIITGKPGTGKTELANTIASQFDKEEVWRQPPCMYTDFRWISEKTKCIILDEFTPTKRKMEQIIMLSTAEKVCAEEKGKERKIIPRPMLIVITQKKIPLNRHYTVVRLKPIK